jgi:hypothetical protein
VLSQLPKAGLGAPRDGAKSSSQRPRAVLQSAGTAEWRAREIFPAEKPLGIQSSMYYMWRSAYSIHSFSIFWSTLPAAWYCLLVCVAKGIDRAMSTSESLPDPHRQQRLYWNQMYELKIAAEYIRLYRDRLGRWVTGLGALKAIASCGGIAAWAIWKQYAFLWGAIIAVSQLTDALKDVFPFAKKYQATCEHCVLLNHLFVDIQLEWESIYSGKFTDDEIMQLRHRLSKQQLDAETRHFPKGLAQKTAFSEQAAQEAMEYFRCTYEVD